MNSESVDLIATDPPFNKGRDFHATPDSLARGASFQDRWSWERDVHNEWVDKITDDFPEVMNVINGSRNSYGDSMGAFLCFMAVRLLEMKRVLKDTGSLFLHCDPTASHYLKELLDAIFGWKHFINEIIWCYIDPAGRRNCDFYKRTHDIIFWYTKNGKAYRIGTIAQSQLADSTIKRYSPYFDPKGQITYRRLKQTNPGTFKSLKGIPEDLDEVWIDNNKGTTMGDWWDDIKPLKRKGGKQKQKESFRYPTQKPLELYKRVIQTASREGDIVLDPFCGCATTCVAAERLVRQWVGIDIWDKAHETVIERLQGEGLASSGDSGGKLAFGDVHNITDPPTRTDDGEPSSPALRTKIKVFEPHGPKMTRAEMYKHLLSQKGCKCQGCDRPFDDPRYLDLDHNTPRSDGGINHISNRILLCGPCNRLKSNTLTLTGLRRKNKKLGYMPGSGKEHPIMQEVRAQKKAAPPLFE